MAAAPPQVANFIKDVAALKKRVREIELALRKTAATLKIKLASLTDVKVAGAVNHQVLTFMDADWVPRGGNWIEWTGSDTGTGTLEVDDDLIDPSEWPADQVWLATASVKLTGTFDPTDAYVTGTTPISLGIDPDPQAITLDADPSTSLTFTGGSLVVDFPMDLLEQRANIPRLSIGFTDGATPLAGSSVDASYTFLASAAWLHEPGATPHIHAELISDATTYPSGGTIDVTVHLYPLA